MGKSIDPVSGPAADPAKSKGSRFNPAPPLIRSMSLQLAIPRQVGLHQSPPPLHQPGLSLKQLSPNDNRNPANSKLSNIGLSHSRGAPQNLSSAFSTEVAATATKQSENLFWETRIYIDESAILKLEHQKAIQKARIARA